VFNEFINQNKFVIETETHIKFIEYNKKKNKILCKVAYIKNLMKKSILFLKKINLIYIKSKKNYK